MAGALFYADKEALVVKDLLQRGKGVFWDKPQPVFPADFFNGAVVVCGNPIRQGRYAEFFLHMFCTQDVLLVNMAVFAPVRRILCKRGALYRVAMLVVNPAYGMSPGGAVLVVA